MTKGLELGHPALVWLPQPWAGWCCLLGSHFSIISSAPRATSSHQLSGRGGKPSKTLFWMDRVIAYWNIWEKTSTSSGVAAKKTTTKKPPAVFLCLLFSGTRMQGAAQQSCFCLNTFLVGWKKQWQVLVRSRRDAQGVELLSQNKPYFYNDFSSRNHTLITKYLLKVTSIVCIPSYFLA